MFLGSMVTLGWFLTFVTPSYPMLQVGSLWRVCTHMLVPEPLPHGKNRRSSVLAGFLPSKVWSFFFAPCLRFFVCLWWASILWQQDFHQTVKWFFVSIFNNITATFSIHFWKDNQQLRGGFIFFTPIWGRFPVRRTYFSIGLKSPTRIFSGIIKGMVWMRWCLLLLGESMRNPWCPGHMVVSTAEKDLYRCKVEELAHRGFTMKLGIYVGFRPKPTDYLFGSCRGISRDSRAKNCMVILEVKSF